MRYKVQFDPHGDSPDEREYDENSGPVRFFVPGGHFDVSVGDKGQLVVHLVGTASLTSALYMKPRAANGVEIYPGSL